MDFWVISSFCLLWIKLLWTFSFKKEKNSSYMGHFFCPPFPLSPPLSPTTASATCFELCNMTAPRLSCTAHLALLQHAVRPSCMWKYEAGGKMFPLLSMGRQFWGMFYMAPQKGPAGLNPSGPWWWQSQCTLKGPSLLPCRTLPSPSLPLLGIRPQVNCPYASSCPRLCSWEEHSIREQLQHTI